MMGTSLCWMSKAFGTTLEGAQPCDDRFGASPRGRWQLLESRRMLADFSGTSGDDNVIIYTDAGQAHFIVNGVDHTTTDTTVNFHALQGKGPAERSSI